MCDTSVCRGETKSWPKAAASCDAGCRLQQHFPGPQDMTTFCMCVGGFWGKGLFGGVRVPLFIGPLESWQLEICCALPLTNGSRNPQLQWRAVFACHAQHLHGLLPCHISRAAAWTQTSRSPTSALKSTSLQPPSRKYAAKRMSVSSWCAIRTVICSILTRLRLYQWHGLQHASDSQSRVAIPEMSVQTGKCCKIRSTMYICLHHGALQPAAAKVRTPGQRLIPETHRPQTKPPKKPKTSKPPKTLQPQTLRIPPHPKFT